MPTGEREPAVVLTCATGDPTARDRRQAHVWLTVGLLVAVGQIGYAAWRAFVGHADLLCFHHSSLHWWQTGEFTQQYGVRHYLPAFVVLMAPLVAWPLAVTAPLWATLNVGLLVLAVRESVRQAWLSVSPTVAPGSGGFPCRPFGSSAIQADESDAASTMLDMPVGGENRATDGRHGFARAEPGYAGAKHGGRPLHLAGDGQVQTAPATAVPSAEDLPPVIRWVWPFVLVLPYASGTLSLGQVNILVLFLCVWAFRSLTRRRDLWSGALLGLAATIKLYPLIFIVPLLMKARWRAIVGLVVSFLLLAGGLSLAGLGGRGTIEAHRQWWAEASGKNLAADVAEGAGVPGSAPVGEAGGGVAFTPHTNEFHRHNNQSLAVVVRRLTTPLEWQGRVHEPWLRLTLDQAKWAYRGPALALLLCLTAIAWRRRSEDIGLGEWSAWLASVIAFVPVFWTHYFVLLLPAAVLMAMQSYADRLRGHPWRTAAFLQLGWLAGLLLLGSREARWWGLQAGLALALGVWTATFPARRSAPRGGAADVSLSPSAAAAE